MPIDPSIPLKAGAGDVDGIDPSIPLQAGKGVTQPQNMLDTFGKYQGIANAMASNDLIKANTAQTNQNVAQSAGNYMAQKYASFLKLPEELQTQATARQFVTHSLQEGSITQQQHDVMMDKINQTQDVGGLRNLAVRGMVGNLVGPQQVEQLFGTNGILQTGGDQQPFVARPTMDGGGITPVGPAVPNTLPPSSQTDLVQVPKMGPDGKPIPGAMETITRAEAARRSGLGNLVPGNGPPPQSPLNTPAGPMGTGRFPALLLNPNRQPPTSAIPPAAPQVPVGLGSTAGTAQTTAAAENASLATKAFQDITSQGVAARQQDAVLSGMQNTASQFVTGRGANAMLDFKATTQSLVPSLAKAFGIDPNSIAQNETFNKLAAQLQTAQGAGTDARLQVAGLANPDAHLSPAGVSQIISELRGNVDYLQARAALAQKFPDQTNSRAFEDQIGTNLDPRVFQYNRLNAAQRGDFFKGLTDKEAFKQKHAWAQGNGLLNAGQ